MEKINISQKDFDYLALEVLRTFYNYDGSSEESIKEALKENIFNIKKEFEENSWNDCDVEVPSEFYCKDLLIRLKNTPKDNRGNTIRCSDYKVGYFRGSSNSFVYYDGNLLVDLYNLDKYEYKLIK